MKLLPGYLALADAHICTQQLKRSENFLVAASSNVVTFQDQLAKAESDKVSESLSKYLHIIRQLLRHQSLLEKITGKLNISQRLFNEALSHLSLSVYI